MPYDQELTHEENHAAVVRLRVALSCLKYLVFIKYSYCFGSESWQLFFYEINKVLFTQLEHNPDS